MDIKTKFKQLISALLNNIEERKKWILALSCLVVFFTTYLLILPAFTLDKEEAAEQGGIDVPGVEQSVDSDKTAEDLAVNKPAKTAKKEINKSDAKKKSADVILENDESDDFVVAVEGKDAVLSEDMSVAVREIEQSDKKQKEEYESLYNDALEAVQKAQEKEGLEKPSDFAFAKFYDISLMDGTEAVQPGSAVDVKISFSEELQKELKVTDSGKVHIVHFAVDEETGEVTPEVLDTESTDVTVENKKITEAAFTTESFSVFAVVYTVDFHWTVDGKEYEYNMIGGSTVSLHNLIEALGVLENTEYGSAGKFTVDDFMKDIEKVEFSNEDLLKVVQVTEDTTAGNIKETLKLEPEYSAALTKEQIAEMDELEIKAPDWALFSMKSFTSDETLTIKMKDGEEWIIRVTDPVTDTAPGNMQVLRTADTRAQGIKMWLFDYDEDHSLDNENNKANNDNNKQDGINAYSDYKFLGWGAGNKNGDGANATGINDFTGLDNNSGNNIRALQGIVQNSLVGGYPVLNNGTSLAYLFDPTANTNDRVVYGGGKNEGNINGLFEYKNGYYIYDSDEHYAELMSDKKNFKVYTTTLAQTDKYGNNHNPTRAVGFFPFDTYAHVYNDLKYENDNNHYGNRGTLYLNPDSTVTASGPGWEQTQAGPSGLNHHLGVAMEMDFVIPKGGVDENDNPIEFNFSGDDDMWVFIDDQLVLDIGGLHQPVDGTINFQTGKATITGKATQAGHTDNTGSNAVVTAEGAQNPRGNNFEFYSALNMLNGGDGKTHTMKIFYVERGGCDSNCMISFNLPLVKGKADVKVAKCDQSSNPVSYLKGVKFGLYSDAACTDLIEEASSNENGILLFESLGIKDDNQKYYIKETQALPGYKMSDDVYTLVAAKDSSDNYYFKVMKGEEEIGTIGQEPAIPVIYNEPIEPIDLTVEKKWQNQNGNEIAAPADASATFKIQRYFKYEQDIEHPSEPVTFRVYRYKENNTPVKVGNDYTFKGGTQVSVNWGYTSDYYRGNHSSVEHYKETPNESYKLKTNPVIINLPESGEAAIYIRDENVGTQWGAGVTNITVNGTPYTQSGTTEHISTDWDEDTSYNSSSPTLTLPGDKVDEDHPWKGEFSDLKTVELKDGKTYYYRYYIVETAKTPADANTVYVDGTGKEISDLADLQTDQDGTTQTIYNRIPTGFLNINKSVTYNGVAPSTAEQRAALAGDYVFTVYTDEACSIPCKTAQGNDLTLTVTITNDGTAKTSDTVELPVGNYWIKEANPANIGVTPEENPISVTVTEDNTASAPAQADFINNKTEDKNPDEMAIDIEKTFEGLPNAGKIPGNFYPVLTYSVPGSNTPVNVELKDTQGNVVRTVSDDGMTWHWHVIRIPTNATDFAISEQNYNITGYERTTTINGDESHPIENPDQPQSVNVLVPEITLTEVATASDYTTPDNNKAFLVTDNQILLVRMTSNATVIVSQKSLSKATRQAIQNLLKENGGKVPGDNAQAKWKDTYVYFSKEVHGSSFSYGGRTIYFGNDNIVTIPHNASSHEVRATIEYKAGSAAENSITLKNKYEEIPVDLDVVKIKKDSDPVEYLPGAEFSITKLDETSGMIEVEDDGETPVFTQSGTTSDEEGSEGRLTFTELYNGIYELKENRAPAGYVLVTDLVLYLRVEDGQVTWLEKGTGEGGTVTWTPRETNTDENGVEFTAATPASGSTEASNAAFTVPNEPGTELPHTGGVGTTFFYILGVTLILGVGMIFWKRQRTN